MKTPALLSALAGAFALLALPLHSQDAKLPPEQQLKAMKEQNQKLIEKQAAALEKLDAILKDAQQLRVFARRS